MSDKAPKREILVVDDTALLRELNALYLSRLGHVRCAASGNEALDLIFERTPDLVVSDLQMPEMDGIELCRRIKQNPHTQKVPFIIFSGSADPRDRERGFRAGAADYLIKPIERPELLAAARRLLRNPEPRGLPRIDLEAWTTLRSPALEWSGRVRNLSRGGMFVESSRALEPDAEVVVQIALPESGEELVSTAQVRWVRRERNETLGMGLRFLALDGDSARTLSRYVGERVPAFES